MQLDEAAGKIYLAPFARATKLIVYSLDNENLPDIPLVYQQTKFHSYVENDVVTVLSMPFNIKDVEPIPIAYRQSTDGELIDELKAHDHLLIEAVNPKGQFVGFNSEISSYRNADANDLFILPWGTESYDTLYHYDTKAKRLLPKYVATFNEKKHTAWTYE